MSHFSTKLAPIFMFSDHQYLDLPMHATCFLFNRSNNSRRSSEMRIFYIIVTCFLGNQTIQRFVARQQLGSLPPLNNETKVGRSFLCCPCRGYITPMTSCQRQLQRSSRTDTVEWHFSWNKELRTRHSWVGIQTQLSDSTVTEEFSYNTVEWHFSWNTESPEQDIVQKWIIVQRGTKKIEVKIRLSGRAARNIIFRR
jgi:hypothetical protein